MAASVPAGQPVLGRLIRLGKSGARHFLTGYWLILWAFVLIALLAPILSPHDPVQADSASLLLPPSGEHLFGTDIYGMDVFSRVLWATRTDFSISIIGVLLAIGGGVPLGALAGYLGGFADDSLSRLSEIIQAIPLFLFALMVFAALGNSRLVLIGIIAFVNVPIFLKLTRSVVLPLKRSDFVAAAQCAGLTPTQVVLRHVLPNSLGPMASQFSVSCAYAIQVVAGLSFLGLGVPIPYPEWGSMIQEGAGRMIYGQWWVSVFPGLAVLLAVIAFGGIGRQLSGRYRR